MTYVSDAKAKIQSVTLGVRMCSIIHGQNGGDERRGAIRFCRFTARYCFISRISSRKAGTGLRGCCSRAARKCFPCFSPFPLVLVLFVTAKPEGCPVPG